METVFLHALNAGITAGWLVPVVLLLRLLLRKAPRAFSVALWALVGIRLVCPFSVESAVSLLPSAQTVPPEFLHAETPVIHSGVSFVNATVNPLLSETAAAPGGGSLLRTVTEVAAWIWLAGVVALLLYGALSYLRLRRQVRVSLRQGDAYLCDEVSTPFILGILKPRIYLPSHVEPHRLTAVLAHEQAHLRRRDHWWKPLGFLLLAIYWFHPLLWVAYALLCRDIEYACDEAVVRSMDTAAKKDYAEALAACSVSRRRVIACPLAFGEGSVKERIRSVLHYRKPALWLVLTAVVLSTAAAVCLLTDPPSDDSSVSQVGGADGPVSVTKGIPLTLEAVRSLADKKDGLRAADLAPYRYYETGSGLYIRCYEIDAMFSLCVGWSNTAEEPLYFYLKAADASGEFMDIRSGDVADFIRYHQRNPVVKQVGWGYHACPVSAEQAAYEAMLNAGGIPAGSMLNSQRSLPVVRVTNVAGFKRFCEQTRSVMGFHQAYDDAPSFTETAAEYTDAFFTENDLLLVYATAGTLADRFSLESVSVSEGILTVAVVEERAAAGDTARQGWLVCVSVPKTQVEGVNTVTARVAAIVQRGADPEADPLAVYSFPVADAPRSPQITLYDNGHFTFRMPAFSSYFGTGTYWQNDRQLILRTDDGAYTFYYDRTGSTVTLNEAVSTLPVWLAADDVRTATASLQ